MYASLLTIHSLFRWLVLLSIVYATIHAYRGWLSDKVFTKLDNTIRHWTATIAHIQLSIGIWIYFISPIVDYFLNNTSEAMHMREIRFFGLEHSSMMFAAILAITFGSSFAKRKPTDKQKFKTMAIWFTIGLIIILVNIPWSFSPLTSRPNFRWF